MIKTNKKILTILLIVLAVILLIVLIIISNRLTVTTKGPSNIPVIQTEENLNEVQPVQTDISQLSKEITDTVAQKEKEKLVPQLPITTKDFPTSDGITTNFNIFSVDSEPSQVIHIEVYGINYNLSDSSLDNPQAVAFIESFKQVKKILSEKGIDINKLQIIFGNRQYIQSTSEGWVKYFKLLP